METAALFQRQEGYNAPLRLANAVLWQPPALLTVALALLIALPALAAVALAPSLFATDAPMALMQPWLAAQDVISSAPAAEAALAEGRLPYLLALASASAIVSGPGEALLLAQAIIAAVLVLPLTYCAARRLPLVPALVLVLLVLLYLLVPSGGYLQAEQMLGTTTFFWLFLASYARPIEADFAASQREGILAGVGLVLLYLTSMALLFLAFANLVAAILLQRRCGMIFTAMALGTLLILGACTEMLNYVTFGGGEAGYVSLVEQRLSAIAGSDAPIIFTKLHWLAAGIAAITILASGRIVFILTMTAGSIISGYVFTHLGADLLPLILLISFIALARGTHPHEERRRSAGFVSGRLALTMVPLMFAISAIAVQAGALRDHYRYQATDETGQFGFAFADEPVLARLILARRLDADVVREGLALTPADQALLLTEGLKLASEFDRSRKATGLITAGNLRHLPDADYSPLSHAEVILTPKLPIDPLTDEARVTHQGLLFAQYRRASRLEQVSPAWEIWVRE